MEQLRGTGVALVTPFKGRNIDFDALERIVEYNIEGGVEYLVSLGTTGEAVNLSEKECQRILDFTVKTAAARVPVVAGLFGDNNTHRLIQRLERYNLNGMAAVMSASPHYIKPNQEGIYRHYMEVIEESPLPMIIYNVPGRTSSNITAETTLRLARASEKFVAIKEASGNLLQASKIIKHRPDGFLVLSGDDPTALGLLACGGEGVISVIANAFPKRFSQMVRMALAGDFSAAAAIHAELADVHDWLYIDGNPVGIKAALQLMGFCAADVRLPLAPMSATNLERLRVELEKVTKGTLVEA